MKRILNIIMLVCIICYTGFLLLLFFFQNSLLYFPDTTDFYSCDLFKKEEQKQYKNTHFYEKKGENNSVIVFFHGNAGRACDRKKIADIFEETGYSFIFVEYSGYAEGNSDNQPDIKNILQNVDDIGEYINNSNYTKVISSGRSIGTGPASYLAGKLNTEKLLLISPYADLYRVAEQKYPIFPIKYLFRQNYNNIEYLKNFSGKTLIIHGKQDSVIPLNHGKRLYNNLNTIDKELFEVPLGNHNNELYIDGIEEKIVEFMK